MWDDECLDDCEVALDNAIDNLSKVVSNKTYGCYDLDEDYKKRLVYALEHLRAARKWINKP
jgi:hypothetical protein